MISGNVLKKSVHDNKIPWIIIFILLSLILFAISITLPNNNYHNSNYNISFYLQSLNSLGSLFTTIIVILFGLRLVVREVDNGTLTILLNSPISRTRIIITKAISNIILVILLLGLSFLIGYITIIATNKPIDISKLILAFITLLTYAFMLSGIVFIFSCIFNKSSLAFLIGGGVPIIFYILEIVQSFDQLKNFQYLTTQTLINNALKNIIHNESIVVYVAIFLIVGLALYIGSMFIFKNKDMPL